MKTYDTIKWGKGYYLMTRIYGMAQGREYFKTLSAMNARIKVLKAEGYVPST